MPDRQVPFRLMVLIKFNVANFFEIELEQTVIIMSSSSSSSNISYTADDVLGDKAKAFLGNSENMNNYGDLVKAPEAFVKALGDFKYFNQTQQDNVKDSLKQRSDFLASALSRLELNKKGYADLKTKLDQLQMEAGISEKLQKKNADLQQSLVDLKSVAAQSNTANADLKTQIQELERKYEELNASTQGVFQIIEIIVDQETKTMERLESELNYQTGGRRRKRRKSKRKTKTKTKSKSRRKSRRKSKSKSRRKSKRKTKSKSRRKSKSKSRSRRKSKSKSRRKRRSKKARRFTPTGLSNSRTY